MSVNKGPCKLVGLSQAFNFSASVKLGHSQETELKKKLMVPTFPIMQRNGIFLLDVAQKMHVFQMPHHCWHFVINVYDISKVII